MVKNFIRKAHLEVLKSEDIEDQINARRLSDILCSPRRPKQLPIVLYGYDSHQTKENKNLLSKQSMDSRRPQPPLLNTYVKDHFWPYQFI